jgi:hypothetical protein
MKLRCSGIMRIAPCDDTAARGAALTGCQISIGKSQTISRKPVNMGCPDIGMTVTSQVCIRDVISNDEDEVGSDCLVFLI